MSLNELKRAVVLAPDDIEARLALATAFADEDRLPEAMKQVQRALKVNPDHPGGKRLHAQLTARLNAAPDGYWNSALDCASRHRLDDALLFGWAACQREPLEYKRWAQLAEWFSLRRHFERALLAYGRALHISQREPRLLEARDQLLKSLGQDDAVDLFSDCPGGPLQEALEHFLEGDWVAGKRALATADDAVQSTGFFHRIRAEVWAAEGESARAQKALLRAKDFDGRDYRLGRLSRLIDARTAGRIGVLGWSERGGAVSVLEAVAVPGDGRLRFTGNVGEHIKESCAVAHTCLKAAGARLAIDGLVAGMDLHLHFTDIETTKEGFSAGLALALAGLSALRRRPLVPRLATTGALTLHGEVQRIEGVYEKAVAARLAGVRRLLYPRGNSAEVKSLPGLVTQAIDFIAVESLDEALQHAFA